MASVKAAVLTVSDGAARGEPVEDSAALLEWLARRGARTVKSAMLPNQIKLVSGTLAEWADSGEFDLILISGARGASLEDVTTLATRSILEQEIAAVADLMRGKGVAGIRWRTLIFSLPQSRNCALENLELLWPAIRQTVAELKAPEPYPEVQPANAARLQVVSLEAKPESETNDLLAKVSAELRARGWRVGGMRHDAQEYGLAVDHPGEESLACYFGNVDIVLTEGFRQSCFPRIELHRAERRLRLYRGSEPGGAPFLAAAQSRLEVEVPLLDIDEISAIAGLIEQKLLLFAERTAV